MPISKSSPLYSLYNNLNIRSKSMIMTIFGDIVQLHGGRIWLSNLVDILSLFNVDDTHTRTNVYRLRKDKLLEFTKEGRMTAYRLSVKAEVIFTNNNPVIYNKITLNQLKTWTIIYVGHIEKNKRKEFTRQLCYQGFSELTSKILFNPHSSEAHLKISRDLGILENILVFCSQLSKNSDKSFIKKLVYQKWDLETHINNQNTFIKNFLPWQKNISKCAINTLLNDKEILMLRLMLLHEFRRLMIKDPLLPEELLPSHWHYDGCYQLTAKLYQALYPYSLAQLGKYFEQEPKNHSRFQE